MVPRPHRSLPHRPGRTETEQSCPAPSRLPGFRWYLGHTASTASSSPSADKSSVFPAITMQIKYPDILQYLPPNLCMLYHIWICQNFNINILFILHFSSAMFMRQIWDMRRPNVSLMSNDLNNDLTHGFDRCLGFECGYCSPARAWPATSFRLYVISRSNSVHFVITDP